MPWHQTVLASSDRSGFGEGSNLGIAHGHVVILIIFKKIVKL